MAYVQGNKQKPTFDLSPARVNFQNFIDHGKRSGQKLFRKGTASLGYTFDIEEDSMQIFIENLRNREVLARWDSGKSNILTINIKYGIYMGRLPYKKYTPLYINSKQTIMASLSDSGRLELLTESDNYTVDEIFSVPLLFKVLMKASTDTRASETYIRSSLSNMYANGLGSLYKNVSQKQEDVYSQCYSNGSQQFYHNHRQLVYERDIILKKNGQMNINVENGSARTAAQKAEVNGKFHVLGMM